MTFGLVWVEFYNFLQLCFGSCSLMLNSTLLHIHFLFQIVSFFFCPSFWKCISLSLLCEWCQQMSYFKSLILINLIGEYQAVFLLPDWLLWNSWWYMQSPDFYILFNNHQCTATLYLIQYFCKINKSLFIFKVYSIGVKHETTSAAVM